MSDCRLQAQTPATTYLSITQANTPDPKFSIMCSSAARSVAHAVMTLGEGFSQIRGRHQEGLMQLEGQKRARLCSLAGTLCAIGRPALSTNCA